MNSRQRESHIWLCSLRDRLGRDPTDLLRDAACPLAHHYAARWDTRPDFNGSQGEAAYESRLAAAVEYHWWRHCENGFRPLDHVIRLVQSGRLAYGRFSTDVLSEVTLAEGVCQRDPSATEHFFSEYSTVISAAADRVGGVRARQELEGFEAELMIPRGHHPPKLATFGGHTPLKNWLRRVVWNQWQSRLRSQREFTRQRSGEQFDRNLSPGEAAQEYECLAVLRPLFEGSASALDTDEVLLLRMVLLDGVPQQELARLWGVHKSTITRNRQRACQKLVDGFWLQARRLGQQSEYEDCIEWITAASQQMWLTLGNYLAERIRRY